MFARVPEALRSGGFLTTSCLSWKCTWRKNKNNRVGPCACSAGSGVCRTCLCLQPSTLTFGPRQAIRGLSQCCDTMGTQCLNQLETLFFFLWKMLYQQSATYLMQRVAPEAMRCPRMVGKMSWERQGTKLCSSSFLTRE